MGCRCNSRDAALCQCGYVDSDCFDLSGTGSPNAPFRATPKIDPVETNLISCGVGGMFADIGALYRNPPRCKIHRNVMQTIPADTQQFMEFNRVLWDVGGFFDPGSDAFRLTCPADGYYEIKFKLDVTAATSWSGLFYVGVVKNTDEPSVVYTAKFQPSPPDYIRNGSFENGLNGWTSTGPVQTNRSGVRGLYSCGFSPAHSGTISQTLGVTADAPKAGDTFDIGMWVIAMAANQPPIGIRMTYIDLQSNPQTVVLAKTALGLEPGHYQRLGAIWTVPNFGVSGPPVLEVFVDGTLTSGMEWDVDLVSAVRIGTTGDVGQRLRDSTKHPFKAGDYINLLTTNSTTTDLQCVPNSGLDNLLEMCWLAPLN